MLYLIAWFRTKDAFGHPVAIVSTLRLQCREFKASSLGGALVMIDSRRHAEVAELRGIQSSGAATAHGQADVAIRRHRHGGAAHCGPGGAVGPFVSGDGGATADEAHPSIRHDAGAAVASHVATASGGSADPAISASAGHPHEDLHGVSR